MFLSCHYFSFVLGRNVEVNVIVPTPEGNEQITAEGKEARYDYENGLPVVYLLHGAYGDNNSWMRFSSVERALQAHNCIGVMAGVENSFYQDMVHGSKYYTFMTEELPAYITRIFPASKKREDTYIAGFSMGGYGAWYLALSRPDLYAKSASMSGALDIAALYESAKEGAVESPFAWRDIFGHLTDHLAGTDRDLFTLYERDRATGLVPKLYQSCGDKDFLFELNQKAHKRLTDLGADITYYEAPGHMHNWDFWDQDIKRILDWFME
ncbi:MAG: esterase family protein [Lachnospiraceae bacterium]|nr:esterase family protein [Lachnospiraceae bacterium]